MKKCPKCGAMINDDDNYCTNCGCQIEDTPLNNTPETELLSKREDEKLKKGQNPLKGCFRIFFGIISWSVNIIVIVVVLFAISLYNGKKDKSKTFGENILLMLSPELKYIGEYTVCVDSSDECYALTLEKEGTAIFGDIGAHKGQAYTWEITKWYGKEYLTLRAESSIESNLYIIDDKVYDSEFELRRGTDKYRYVITHKASTLFGNY